MDEDKREKVIIIIVVILVIVGYGGSLIGELILHTEDTLKMLGICALFFIGLGIAAAISEWRKKKKE